MTPEQRNGVAVAVMASSVVSSAGTIFLLGQPVSERSLVATGSLAGAASSTLFLLVRSQGWPALAEGIASNRGIAAAASLLMGLAAGGFSVMAAIALVGGGILPDQSSGAAILGGLYGLALGASWSQFLLARSGENSVLGAALSGIEQQLHRSSPVNYDGLVLARVEPETHGVAVKARVAIWFQSTDVRSHPPNGKAQGGDMGEPPSPSGSVEETPAARVRVTGGEKRKLVPFVVTVTGRESTTSFPRRQLASAPAKGKSDAYPFTIVNDNAKSEIGRSQTESVQDIVMVEVGQAGKTVAILELAIGETTQ